MSLIDKIPFMSAIERVQLRRNCEKAKRGSNSSKRREAEQILAALDALETGDNEENESLSRRATRRFGGTARGSASMPPRRTLFTPDPAYEQTRGVKETLAAIDAKAPVILVTGRAGTGKTTLIRYLKARPGGETQIVVAPTGVAALNAEAQTIHSFFQLPFGVLDARNLAAGKHFGPLYQRMTRLVIDEISMVRADVIDAIDTRLKEIRKDPRPFGGVQIVMVGDFLQLPPVVQQADAPLIEQLDYSTPYAFSAHVFQRIKPVTVTLDEVHRQDEREFVDLLNAIRLGEDVEHAVETLNARCFRPHRAGVTPLLLTATRAAADRYNQQGLDAIAGETSVYGASTAGKFDLAGDRLPAPEHLELKIGTRVMATRNDPERRWINGSLGTVSRIEDDEVSVRFDATGLEHVVAPVSWDQIRQVWDEGSQTIRSDVVGSFKQVPLAYAWAVTIHKAQGLTLDDVRIDLVNGAFAPGQTYVALSRVRTMAGLSLARPLRASDLKTDPMLVAYQTWVGEA
jgi:ATP-dependent DNA helicase PIF1